MGDGDRELIDNLVDSDGFAGKFNGLDLGLRVGHGASERDHIILDLEVQLAGGQALVPVQAAVDPGRHVHVVHGCNALGELFAEGVSGDVSALS